LDNFLYLFEKSTGATFLPTKRTTVTMDDNSIAYNLWPKMAQGSIILQLDALFGTLFVLTWIHACRHRGNWEGSLLVVFLAVHTAIFEHCSLFLGGTHCHATSPLGRFANLTPCSSLNSILFYVPWIYTSIEGAWRLLLAVSIRRSSWNKFQSMLLIIVIPFLVGLLQFGFGVVYELQGPWNNFWSWPDYNGVIASSRERLGPWEGYSPLKVLLGAKNSHVEGVATIDWRGAFRVSEHAMVALEERIYGVPVLAPYFHFCYGFAWAAGLLFVYMSSGSALVGGSTESDDANTIARPSLYKIAIAGLQAPILFVIPIEMTRNLSHTLGVKYLIGVILSLALSSLLVAVVLQWLKTREGRDAKDLPKTNQTTFFAARNTTNSTDTGITTSDPLLFSISFLMHAFFAFLPFRSTVPTPNGLELLVATIGGLHLVAQYYCCMVVTQ